MSIGAPSAEQILRLIKTEDQKSTWKSVDQVLTLGSQRAQYTDELNASDRFVNDGTGLVTIDCDCQFSVFVSIVINSSLNTETIVDVNLIIGGVPGTATSITIPRRISSIPGAGQDYILAQALGPIPTGTTFEVILTTTDATGLVAVKSGRLEFATNGLLVKR